MSLERFINKRKKIYIITFFYHLFTYLSLMFKEKCFVFNDQKIYWLNVVSKYGCIKLEVDTDDKSKFTKAFILAEKISDFFKGDDFKAQDTCYHSVNRGNNKIEMFVLPRYKDDYEDNNVVYQIVEKDVKDVSVEYEVLEKYFGKFEAYLNGIMNK